MTEQLMKTREMTTDQDIALRALLARSSVTEAARQANVARQTVAGWMHHDPTFMAALNAALTLVKVLAHLPAPIGETDARAIQESQEMLDLLRL
jgi:1,6-anhydro-N-acetylmuramate kinase